MKASEANRIFYAQIAGRYAEHVKLLPGDADHARLVELLDYALEFLPPIPSVLDACGGSGNASLALKQRDIPTTLVDVSSEMIALYRAEIGTDVETIEADIEGFLATDGRQWDLIVFSSALHHLDDPAAVVRAAARKLAPGGVLLTVFDPRRTSRLGYVLRRLDYMGNEFVARPVEALKKARARLSRAALISEGSLDLGSLAERWANIGVDDALVCAVLAEEGCKILRHHLYFGGRLWPTRMIVRAVRLPWSFSILAQRNHSADR